MCLINKIFVILFCVFIAGYGIFGAQKAQAVGGDSNSTLTVEQLRQIIASLKAQIDQLILQINQKKNIKPVCGNSVCETAKGETAISCAMDCKLSTHSTDKIADWKTYANGLLGFEINYPADFNLIEDGKNRTIDRTVEIKKDNSVLQVIFNPIITGGGCGKAGDFTFDTIIDLPEIIRSEKAIVIDGQSLKILYSILASGSCNDYIPGKCTKNTRVSAYVVPISGKSGCSVPSINGVKYAINFGGEFDAKNLSESLGVFEKILTTIKFNKPTGSK
jgi:hypothetical protein